MSVHIDKHTDYYAIDVTHWPRFHFTLVDNDGNFTGLDVIAARCPGKLIAAIHADGNEAVGAWADANPHWHEDHRAIRNFSDDRIRCGLASVMGEGCNVDSGSWED